MDSNFIPPIEKVYEAWSALADGRMTLVNDNEAVVRSSDGTKTYTVRYDPRTDSYSSSDNATYWRGYAGYPILVLMMATGRLPYDAEYVSRWADVNWTALNKKYKRDYAAAVRHVEDERGIDHAEAQRRAEEVMSELEALPVKVKRVLAAIA